MIRAHQDAAGARKKYSNRTQEQALGRSAGGFSTKIHAAWDALGTPIRFILSPSQYSGYQSS
ncbi:hypothetical protein HCUR_00842 [Holospora curviuscula]|uniref:Transposase n=1 Tax=Holospora curviuscula TaxID=1082868 RepID=A0A2S5R8T3_9PROT|nr:hypothetical protein HCUR_00842 [Holospora curviuscula]